MGFGLGGWWEMCMLREFPISDKLMSAQLNTANKKNPKKRANDSKRKCH